MIADQKIITAKNSLKQQVVFAVTGALILILTGVAGAGSFSLTTTIVTVFAQCGLLIWLGIVFRHTAYQLMKSRKNNEVAKTLAVELANAKKNCSARSRFIESTGGELLETSRAMFEAAGFLHENRQSGGSLSGVEEDLLKNADWLYAFSRDIVVLTQLKKGELVLHEQEIDPVELVGWSVAEVRKNLCDNKIVSLMKVPQNPVLISGDLCKLKQCLAKLVSSACGCLQIDRADVRVSISIRKSNELLVSLKLRGRQLEPAEFQKLCCPLDNFVGEDERIDLDMAIAVRLAELHGGKIVIHEQTSSGTVLAFILPSERVCLKVTEPVC